MSNSYVDLPPSSGGGSTIGIPTYANFASLPGSPTDGQAAITLDTGTLWIYNVAGTAWKQEMRGPLTGDVTTSGTGSATTVASVGGSSAALVHSAELAANAATSGNTANTIVLRDASGNFSTSTPTTGLHAVNKNYVDNKVSGMSWRPEVDLLDTVSTALPTGTSKTIDGVAVTNGMRVLFTNLSSSSNEVYTVSGVGVALVWTLATDGQAGTGAPTKGDALLVLSGTANAGAAYDYSGTAWVQFNGAGQIQAGTGLSKSGNTLSVSLTGSNLPNPSATTLGGVQSFAAVTSQWIRQISTTGVPTASQPAFTDISGSVAAAQLPNPSASTLGGIQSFTAVTSQWIRQISTTGVPTASQPAFSDISGTATNSQIPGLTIQSKSANYTVLSTDRFMIGDATSAAFTFTLPAGASGIPLWFKKKDSDASFNAITITDGTFSTTLNTSGESVTIIYTGSAYEIIDRRIDGTTLVDSNFAPSAGWGTVTSKTITRQRRGDKLLIQGFFIAGTTAASTASISLPTGIAIDYAKISSNVDTALVGYGEGLVSSALSLGSSGVLLALFVDGSATGTLFFGYQSSANQLAKITSTTVFVTGTPVTFWAEIPISGWKG